MSTPSRRNAKRSSDGPIRVVGYVRLSRLTDESTSIERQTKAVQDYCKSRGWELVEIIAEPGVSASVTRLERPGLTRLRAIVASGGIDVVLTWKLDRIVRSVADLAVLLEEFSGSSTALASATQPFDTSTPMGKAMAQMIGVFAELEAATIRERVLDSQAHLRGIGRFPGGRVPFGYRVGPHPSGVGRCWEPEPTEVAAIRHVAKMLLRGESMRDAVAWMNRESGCNRTFSTSTLRQMATSGAWTGRVMSDGKIERDTEGRPVRYGVEIITDSEQARINKRFAETAKPVGGWKTERTTLLSGLLRCSGCGGGMVCSGSAERRTYRCANANMICPRGVGITQHMVESTLAEQFLARLGSEPVFRIWVEHGLPERLPVCEAEIASLTAEIARALAEDRDEEIGALLDRRRSLTAEREELRSQPRETSFRYEETGQTYAEAWVAAEGDNIARRALLDRALESVTVLPTRQGTRNYDPMTRLEFVWIEFLPHQSS